MRVVNIHEAKTHLSRLVEQAAEGQAFMIAKAGKPMVRVVPLENAAAKAPPSRFGFLRGQLKIPHDFDTMGQEEIETLFNGDK
jgi:prevent-host-death family protein